MRGSPLADGGSEVVRFEESLGGRLHLNELATLPADIDSTVR